ncbi:hypothetical protein Afil01_68360 [Actinorhabdospora filicis]|uniref:Integral membrane protein n=1 Tax=Actinorhabdospora filicis TaxID=1785913 RepID=A0A9W6SU72_9ACTN|nr:hypothetical protein Afil01_68360 [Actinorhabdospora filicis]
MLPITLKAVIAALVLEAAGLVTYGSFTLTAAADGQAFSYGAAITEGVVWIVLAVLLGVFAWTLAKRKSWARNATIFLQLMLLPIGYFMIKGGHPGWGVPVLALGLLSVLVLMSAPVREALGIE